jgi:hypothetical protein
VEDVGEGWKDELLVRLLDRAGGIGEEEEVT